MISFLLGFAQIRAEAIPDGIMPKDKRQVVGTGMTSSTVDPPTTSDPVTSDPPTTTIDDPTTSDPPTTDPTTEPITVDPGTTDPGTTEPTSEPTPGSSAVEPTSVPTTVAVTTTNDNGETVTSQISTNTLAPASTTRGNSVASTDSSDTDLVRVGSSTINRSTLSRKTVITSALLGKSTSRSIYTSYWTSNGQIYSTVVTEEQVYSSTTGFATATINPSLANGGGDGSNLSDNAKKVIGGVVGGIGGAILIGGMAFFAWRLWGKKKAAREEPDEVWGGSSGSRPDSIETAKRSSGMGAYETYSNPGGRINTSSNF